MASLAHHNSGILIPRDEYEELTEALATVFRIGARFTPRLIERLDLTDGDPDVEANGDEMDGTFAEDDQGIVVAGYGPGCETTDAGELDGDETDGNGAEDEPCAWFPLYQEGAGCPIADNGLADTGGLYEQQGSDTDLLIPGGGSAA